MLYSYSILIKGSSGISHKNLALMKELINLIAKNEKYNQSLSISLEKIKFIFFDVLLDIDFSRILFLL